MVAPGEVVSRKLALVTGAVPAAGVGRVRFERFELDLGTGELWRDGEAVRVQQQPARVLSFLVRQPGRLVTREELRRHLWGEDVFVDFQRGLNFCIMQIRAALDDDAETPRFVETLPRRGYRFVAPVETVEEATTAGSEASVTAASVRPSPAWRRHALRAALLAASAAAVGAAGFARAGRSSTEGAASPESAPALRIAVLPFRQMGPADGIPVADGLTEEVIAETGRIAPGRLGVIARSSVERYKDRPFDLDRVTRELAVDFVLEGSVRCDAGRVRVTARLVRSLDQSQVWAETYERTLDDVLGLQREIARSAAGGIGVALDPRTLASATPGLRNAEAWRLYLLGRRAFEQRTEESLGRARRHFEAALDDAPDYAPAHAGLADVLLVLVDLGHVPPVEGLVRAEAEARRAVELDPALDSAHASLGGVSGLAGDLEGARRHLERALALNASNSLARKWYCWVLSDSGHRAQALEQARIAALTDPLSVSVVYNLGSRYLLEGRSEEALKVVRQLLEIDGEAMLAHLLHGRVLAALGRTDEAIEALERAHRLDPRALFPLQEIALVQRSAGREAEALAAFVALVDLLEQKPYMNATVAAVAAALGKREEAIRLLQAAVRHREPALVYVSTGPCYDLLRGDPRFVTIQRQIAAGLRPPRTGHPS